MPHTNQSPAPETLCAMCHKPKEPSRPNSILCRKCDGRRREHPAVRAAREIRVKVLCYRLGAYAFVIPQEEIEQIRNSLQETINGKQ